MPKGIAEAGEAIEDVAAREFAEETGYELADVARDPVAPPLDLGEVTLKSGKVIRAWAVEGDLDPDRSTSNEIEIEWPPRTGRRLVIPEVDRVAWFGRPGGHPPRAPRPGRIRRATRGASRNRERDSAGLRRRPRAASSSCATCSAHRGRCRPERESVLRVIDRLGSLQFDPLEVAGRNHDLVLLARIAGYRRDWAEHWLYEDRRLYETYNKGPPDRAGGGAAAGIAEVWDRARLRHDAAAFDDHAPLVDGAAGPHPGAGHAPVPPPRRASGDRLVLASDEPGAGDPRGAGRGRCDRHLAPRGQPRVYDLA